MRYLLLSFLLGCGPAVTAPPEPMTPGVVFVSRGDPFLPGPLEVVQRDLKEGELGAPKAVRLTAPVTTGTYPVVQFQHGFLTDRRGYDEILTHLASHGFVVVAPQMYPADGVPLGKEGAPDEARAARRVAEWAHLNAATIMGSAADPRPIGVAGHSRGGKVSWWLTAQGPLHVPAPPVEAIDTLGAGDVFHGAYALAIAEGRDVEAAARFATLAAAIKCTRPGGRAGCPTRAEVAAFAARG